jgi:hypothetical protein
MARAKVQLRKCESFTGLAGEMWRKNQTRIISDSSKIRYYKGNSEFVVTDLSSAQPKQAAAPVVDAGEDSSSELSEAALFRMTKAELVDFGAEEYGLELDEDEMKKDDLVAAVLEAQG